ncbi:MAG: hypothetical protein DDT26_00120 [Dehalococcoidia bacterium]|nr:hypothetical protein [Chloroflexota bacterium]
MVLGNLAVKDVLIAALQEIQRVIEYSEETDDETLRHVARIAEHAVSDWHNLCDQAARYRGGEIEEIEEE